MPNSGNQLRMLWESSERVVGTAGPGHHHTFLIPDCKKPRDKPGRVGWGELLLNPLKIFVILLMSFCDDCDDLFDTILWLRWWCIFDDSYDMFDDMLMTFWSLVVIYLTSHDRTLRWLSDLMIWWCGVATLIFSDGHVMILRNAFPSQDLYGILHERCFAPLFCIFELFVALPKSRC